MFKKKNLSKNDLLKRVNYKLTSNFYSIEEFKNLSFRKAFKVIKLISKIDKIKLTKKDIKETILYLQSNVHKKNNYVIKLWEFTKNIKENKKTIFPALLIIFLQYFVSAYRLNKFELMRI